MKELVKSCYGEIMTSDFVGRALDALCLDIGHRFAGSDSAARAAAYILKQLQSFGYESAVLEEFPMTVWERGAARLRLTAPFAQDYPCLALPYAPMCDESFDVIDLGCCTESEVCAQAESLKGRAVMVDDRNPAQGPQLHRLQKYMMVREAGAGAFLFVQNSPGMLAPTGTLAFNQEGALDQSIPSVGISYETACELRKRAELLKGPLRIHLTLSNGLRRGSCRNVVAELPGETDEVVAIGGHYDGHDIAQGATDNASGTIGVLELARVLKKLSIRTRCTLKVILFSGEELGLIGSNAYAAGHPEEVARTRMMFNLDCFSGTSGLNMILHGPDELESAFGGYAAIAGDAVNLRMGMLPFSDHFPFILRGAHAAFCYVASGGGRGWGHTIADTFDKVDLYSIRRAAAALAPILIQTLDAPAWTFPKLDVEALKRNLQELRMEQLMRYESHWPA